MRINSQTFITTAHCKIPPLIFDPSPNLKNNLIPNARKNLFNLNPLLIYEYCNKTLITKFVVQERIRENILAK